MFCGNNPKLESDDCPSTGDLSELASQTELFAQKHGKLGPGSSKTGVLHGLPTDPPTTRSSSYSSVVSNGSSAADTARGKSTKAGGDLTNKKPGLFPIATECKLILLYWGFMDFGLGNGLLPDITKPLPEPVESLLWMRSLSIYLNAFSVLITIKKKNIWKLCFIFIFLSDGWLNFLFGIHHVVARFQHKNDWFLLFIVAGATGNNSPTLTTGGRAKNPWTSGQLSPDLPWVLWSLIV